MSSKPHHHPENSNKGKKKEHSVPKADAEAALRQLEIEDLTVAAAEALGIIKKGMTKAQAQSALEKYKDEQIRELQQSMPQLPDKAQEAQERRIRAETAFRSAYMRNEEEQRKLAVAAKYVNVEFPLPAEYSQWAQVSEKRWVRFEQFDGSNEQMSLLVDLFNKELSEPYNSFTYQYFVFGWPDLALLAFGLEQETAPAATEKGTFVGGVVSRVVRKGPNHPLRGYVAMLAVNPSFRGARVGSRLVVATVALMKLKGCDEVSLETPVSNQRALKLYTDLGFCKLKFLPVYYLDGSDAFRLKLYLNDFVKMAALSAGQDAAGVADDDEDAVPPLEEQQ